MIKCVCLDGRTEFLGAVQEKLGAEFLLESRPFSQLLDGLAGGGTHVAIVPVPSPQASDREQRIAQLERIVLNPTGVPVVALVPTPDIDVLREVTACGAYDCISETRSMEEFRIVLRRAARYYQLVHGAAPPSGPAVKRTPFESLLGSDESLTSVIRFAQKVAMTDANVLVTGETGTGKELLARAIHDASSRSAQPFVPVACSSLPETLIEAELFGHEKGAFTGAVAARRGRFEAAEDGTIFLDEIGELSPSLQVKLLRVLQERTFERIGSNQPRPMNARVICATNRDLRAMANAGQFRVDLYFRLNTVQLTLPPLRDRRSDVAMLTHFFLGHCAAQSKRPAPRFSSAALCAMRRYSWPGNVRELQHVVEHAVLMCDGPEITLEHLPTEITAEADLPFELDSKSFDDEVRMFKRSLIERTLRESGNNKVLAARILQISRSTLHRLIDELEISHRISGGPFLVDIRGGSA